MNFESSPPLCALAICCNAYNYRHIFSGTNTFSSDLAKRTFAIFVKDDHALAQQSTMNLLAEAMVNFFDLGGGGKASVDQGEDNDPSPAEENVEVGNRKLLLLVLVAMIWIHTCSANGVVGWFAKISPEYFNISFLSSVTMYVCSSNELVDS